MQDFDPNRLRETEIKRLVQMAELAHKNANDEDLPMRIRGEWHTKYTNIVVAFSQLLRDAQYAAYEARLRAIEEFEKEEQ